jgi:cyclic pyranopterin phosphate synthase
VIGDLRVSVTDRCNFRCQYCMPAEGLPWLERAEILTFEEITRIVALFAGMGVGDVRLTGGEPLVRREFPVLAGMIAAVDGVNDLSVTTNGFLLERDAEKLVRAGINRFNVSVDSLQRDRFYELTRRDALDAVLRGLEVLASFPEAHPIKVNAVAIRGFTEEEVIPFAELARRTPYQVRFIEFMPLDADHAWNRSKVLTGAEIREAITAVYPLEPEPRAPSSTSNVYRFADGSPGRVGFINPVSEPFCADCNRVRLTADGRLPPVLAQRDRPALAARDGASDAELEESRAAVAWRAHTMWASRASSTGWSMSAIGETPSSRSFSGRGTCEICSHSRRSRAPPVRPRHASAVVGARDGPARHRVVGRKLPADPRARRRLRRRPRPAQPPGPRHGGRPGLRRPGRPQP